MSTIRAFDLTSLFFFSTVLSFFPAEVSDGMSYLCRLARNPEHWSLSCPQSWAVCSPASMVVGTLPQTPRTPLKGPVLPPCLRIQSLTSGTSRPLVFSQFSSVKTPLGPPVFPDLSHRPPRFVGRLLRCTVPVLHGSFYLFPTV